MAEEADFVVLVVVVVVVGGRNGAVGFEELERDGGRSERSGFAERGVELERDGVVGDLGTVVVVVAGRGLW